MIFLKKIFTFPVLSRVIFFLLLGSLIAYTIFGDSGLYHLSSLKHSKAEFISKIKESRTRIDLLKKEKILLTNPLYLETIVRKELGYIKDGEVVYQLNP